MDDSVSGFVFAGFLKLANATIALLPEDKAVESKAGLHAQQRHPFIHNHVTPLL